ncbi:ALK and LTK ligand 2, partial [Pteropus vampyrus]|uniref:ALK and LTK ligand 2 n=2 Tax=Pteropus vampyrus TaxID=132908 RepID=A0A6P3S040_PTEVA
MRGPGRPLLLGLLLVLGAAGPGRGAAEPPDAADRQTLLRLVVEIIQELRKYHSGEPKRPPPAGQQDHAPGRSEAADFGLEPEEQRA